MLPSAGSRHTNSYLPESLGMLVRMCRVPVVTVVHHGNHLHAPIWNPRRKRKLPLHTTMTQILTPEQIAGMSVEEINATLRRALAYDDYRYQKEPWGNARDAVERSIRFLSGEGDFWEQKESEEE